MGTRGQHAETRVGSQIRPRLRTLVDILDVQLGLLQKGGKGHAGAILSHRPELFDLPGPTRRHGLADVVEDDLLRDLVELHVATGREEREALLDLSLEVAATATQEGAETAVEAELLSMMAHEIENRALQLAVTLAQPSSQLLEEQRGTVGRAQQEQRVDDRHVNAFIEQVDGEEHVDAARRQIFERALALGRRRVGPYRL